MILITLAIGMNRSCSRTTHSVSSVPPLPARRLFVSGGGGGRLMLMSGAFISVQEIIFDIHKEPRNEIKVKFGVDYIVAHVIIEE